MILRFTANLFLRYKGKRDKNNDTDMTILNHRFNFISFFWVPRTLEGKKTEKNGIFFFFFIPTIATFQYTHCYCRYHCPFSSAGPSLSLSLSVLSPLGEMLDFIAALLKKKIHIVVIHSALPTFLFFLSIIVFPY